MQGETRRRRLEEMVAEDPADFESCYMLGMEHASAGDDEGAVRCFEEVFRVAPAYPHAYHQAGRALVRLGKIEQAKEVLQRGIPMAQKGGEMHAAGEMQGLLESLE
jgi:tetratricopeptide (TPR) repeat protein